jgi:hypothetical protein
LMNFGNRIRMAISHKGPSEPQATSHEAKGLNFRSEVTADAPKYARASTEKG